MSDEEPIGVSLQDRSSHLRLSVYAPGKFPVNSTHLQSQNKESNYISAAHCWVENCGYVLPKRSLFSSLKSCMLKTQHAIQMFKLVI